ncbi:hypothetical protein BKA83DRAFT_19144 [Pisolithus microcarpus]|nr:hypothetical protein BKA83DRAFT_19144 [Pisolithus microcarpus]
MPLDPIPPPSPHGKVSPPKHQCSPDSPCPVQLSEVGRQFHQFQKGTSKARFALPALLKFMTSYFASHPPAWTWTVWGGPNKGKSYQVPTTPIVCEGDAPRAVQWIVTVFHLFKAHPNPLTVDPETGRVKPAWLKLYQNNLYIHLHSQLRSHFPPPKPAPPGPKAVSSHPKPASLIASEVEWLWAELTTLKEKFYKYIASHKACCTHSDSSSSSDSSEEQASDGNQTPQPPPSPLFWLVVQQPESTTVPDDNPPSWLTTTLSCLNLPQQFSEALHTPDPGILELPPCGMEAVIKLHFHNSPPFCLAVCMDRSLHVVATLGIAQGDLATFIKLPPDPSVPTACS